MSMTSQLLRVTTFLLILFICNVYNCKMCLCLFLMFQSQSQQQQHAQLVQAEAHRQQQEAESQRQQQEAQQRHQHNQALAEAQARHQQQQNNHLQQQQQIIQQHQQQLAYQTKGRMPRAKPDAKPKGRMTAYAFFVQTCREEHKKKHPEENVVFTEFTKKCAERWKVRVIQRWELGTRKNHYIYV